MGGWPLSDGGAMTYDNMPAKMAAPINRAKTRRIRKLTAVFDSAKAEKGARGARRLARSDDVNAQQLRFSPASKLV